MKIEKSASRLIKEIRGWLAFFMLAIITSGITAFDVESGLKFLNETIKNEFLHAWIAKVFEGVREVGSKYPFLFYGYDWLAFGHIVIATAFIGPYKDPLKNEWVILFGIIACVMVFPAAFIMGYVRHIEFWWLLIDCSFGFFGLIPLYIVWRKIQRLKKAHLINNLTCLSIYRSEVLV